MGAKMTYTSDSLTLRFSLRALQDFLAGRIDEAGFRQALGERQGEPPLLKSYLEHGYTISDVDFEAGGIDEDDDALLLKFGVDPAVSPFR